jgi:hypothetical protein
MALFPFKCSECQKIVTPSLSKIFMKIGRPVSHIRAHWLSVDLPTGSWFYQLDALGRLLRQNGQILPHHSKLAVSGRPPECLPLPMVFAPPPPVEPVLDDQNHDLSDTIFQPTDLDDIGDFNSQTCDSLFSGGYFEAEISREFHQPKQ